MRSSLTYHRPESLDEALDLLGSGQNLKIVGGGTDLMIDLRADQLKASGLVDVTVLSELHEISAQGQEVVIGAAVTIEELGRSAFIRSKLPVISKAAEVFGGLQIRNQATIGGNVGHASPSGDMLPPLLLYGAFAETASPAGRRLKSVEQLLAGPNRSALAPDEILIKFILKAPEYSWSDFQKIGRRSDLAISRASLAIALNLGADGLIATPAVALGACLPTAQRLPNTESALAGSPVCLRVLAEAGEALASEIINIAGRRPSLTYKEPAVRGLLTRMLLPLTEEYRGDA
jgi:CO/xanthine dehydrogenase FAD-binding subunit